MHSPLLEAAPTVTLGQALGEGTGLLSAVSDEATIEAELLLRHALAIDKVRFFQALNSPLPAVAGRRYRSLLKRRLAHEPIAYITGHREFFGLDFEVTPAALIPRPETETLVETALTFARDRPSDQAVTIADIGTGSGAIAVALAHELPNADLIATDVSQAALNLAQRNADRHAVADRIRFRRGDLLEPLGAPADVVSANLPYVRTTDWERLPLEIRDHEPRAALDGGHDGLREVRRLLDQASRQLGLRGAIFAEVGDDQGDAACGLARAAFPLARLEVLRDLAGRDRVLAVYRPS